MAVAGNSYVIRLTDAHLGWGTYRHTTTRNRRPGEGYIPIPISVSRNLDILNSNQQNISNIYTCRSVDGFFNDVELKASGNIEAGSPYAKQFQGNGNLLLIGDWYAHVGATVGDSVQVTWLSSHHIEIELI
ncbi:hypothetical protein ACIQ2D_04680 [Lysinibacillus sp. NPDC097287]|uniref:hypothetical protein n=1 Tax=Lysinibacillus sp. NPDC097287 TaxID=3364144 RepID=UPI00382E779A